MPIDFLGYRYFAMWIRLFIAILALLLCVFVSRADTVAPNLDRLHWPPGPIMAKPSWRSGRFNQNPFAAQLLISRITSLTTPGPPPRFRARNKGRRTYFSGLKEFFIAANSSVRGLAVPASHMLRIPLDVPMRDAIL
jgi:hypothetical protein